MKLGTKFNKLGTNSDNRGAIFDNSASRGSSNGRQMEKYAECFNINSLIGRFAV